MFFIVVLILIIMLIPIITYFCMFSLMYVNDVILISLMLLCDGIMSLIIIKEIVEIVNMKKKYRKSNYDEIKQMSYFRDLLNEYSISELGFIYNNKMPSDVLISLEIFNLANKNKIKIDGNKIIIMDKENLNTIQSYLIGVLKFIDLLNVKTEYKKRLKSSLKKKGIYQSLVNAFDFSIVLIFVFLYLFPFVMWIGLEIISSFFSVLLSLIYAIEFVILICLVGQESINMKTKKGQEIYFKLLGLKNYLNDFGNFDEKKLKEIALWDDYILYSVILGESKQIQEEALNLLKELSINASTGNLKVIDCTKE